LQNQPETPIPAAVQRSPAARGSRRAAFRAVAAHPHLRRLEGGWAAVVSGESIAQVAIGVLAYHVAGVGGLGALVALQMVPSALLAPWLALLGERGRRERLMLLCDLARLTLALAAALAAAEGVRGWVLYPISVGLAVAQSAFNPARRALVPLLVGAPAQLTAASVVTGLVQAVCQTAAPAIGAVVLAVAGPSEALLVAAAAFAVAVVADLGLPSSVGLAQRPTHLGRPSVRAGAAAALADSRLRLVLGLFAAKNLGRGAVNVLIVLTPLGLLGLGGQAVGWLTAAMGAGGIVGGLVAATLVSRRRLAGPMALGLALWGLPLLAIAALPRAGIAVVALVALGAGNTVCDAAGYSLVSRSTRDDLLVRVYGVHESVRAIAIAIGGSLTALAAIRGGTRDALVAAGAVLTVAALAGFLLRGLDRPVKIDRGWVALLRGVPVLGWLPPIGLERLASQLAPVEFAADAVVLQEGEQGDTAYVIRSGEAVVTVAGTEVARVGPGQLIGEIALLRAGRRTATVTTVTPMRALALDRAEFLVAATGTADARAAGAGLLAERLARGEA
jgi:predicted MFS family arabinose efflux permease